MKFVDSWCALPCRQFAGNPGFLFPQRQEIQADRHHCAALDHLDKPPLREIRQHPAEKQGRTEFSSLWSGQSAALGRALPAEQLTLVLAQEAQGVCKRLGVAGATHAPLDQP